MNRIIALVILLVPILMGIYAYQDLPDQLAIHFGPNGEPDGYQSKQTFFPVYVLLSAIVMGVLPLARKIDPKKENYAKFAKAYSMIQVLVALILGGTFSHLLLYNLGIDTVGADVFAKALLGLAWLVIGNYLPQLRSNYFMGIRTPWTLAHPEVWRKTHRMSGPIWVIAGGLMILSAFLPMGRGSSWPVLSLILFSVIVPIGYSYLAYRKWEESR